MDPILEYLLELNKTTPVEYSDRLLIPTKGLQKMLDNFGGFQLNTDVVVRADRDIIFLSDPEPEPEETDDDILAKLLEEL